ncbi:septation protein SepH [Luedemannella helvata]|uniref:Septation protein SepH n=1 Tax=Luedemannella helvata TaxID=349315 RepID=A0ABN2KNS5_9ACTN
MRQVRFVALSEDGHALVLADEIGHLLALPLDERVNAALAPERGTQLTLATPETTPLLAPRDIQARIRAGETADEVARVAGVPVDRVLRYAGPVLQERAMLAQHARRTRMKVGDTVGKITLAEVVDVRLGQHGVDLEKISWDAYRRDDGTWRIVATWPSGKATATAVWELDKARQVVTPHDEMAQYLCTDRSAPAHEMVRGREPARPEPGRGGHEPMRAPASEPRREPARPGRDPIRAGRDALLASLDRPLQPTGGTRSLEPLSTEPRRPAAVQPSAFEDDRDVPQQVPAVPSLAVLRPRRGPAAGEQPSDDAPAAAEKPRKRAPSWDDVLFGGAPTARDA